MGGPPSPRPFKDDPDALSMHTTAGESSFNAERYLDDNLDDADAPPPAYDDALATESESAPILTPQVDNHYHGELQTGVSRPASHFAYTSKRIGQKRTTIGNEILSVQDAHSDTDPDFLELWIRTMAKYPPSPYIHITGTHHETRNDKDGKSKTEEVTDFRIMISLQNYLWPGFQRGVTTSTSLVTAESAEKTYRGTILKKRQDGVKGEIEVGHTKPTLKEWCHRYCAKATGPKVFRLTRSVTGFNEDGVREDLTYYIRQTNYKGRLSIEFPVGDRAVDIYSSSRLNNWRLTSWICWLFYLTFLWIFSWPVLFFSTKRYEVVKVIWPFSRENESGVRVPTTVDEYNWTKMYAPAIKQLCLDRYQGLAGDNLLNEILERSEAPSNTEQAIGRAVVGAAAAAFQGGQLNTEESMRSMMRIAGVASDRIGWGFDT
ncbi:hypothetical protein FHETE_6169 [Fusarium heterosporum]|uniref:Uncharacterized protein n=1 Tax=Fusarium heterosporum TaxID=42747 RepID=A0A8H5T6R8_FUSHE|nr:hypothetical protein FHETE_6169 [Fusarium heterosporum]